MEKYEYSLTFKEGGKVVVEKALSDFRAFCEKKLAAGELVPYTAYQITIDNLLDQLKENKKAVKEEDGAYGIFKEIKR